VATIYHRRTQVAHWQGLGAASKSGLSEVGAVRRAPASGILGPELKSGPGPNIRRGPPGTHDRAAAGAPPRGRGPRSPDPRPRPRFGEGAAAAAPDSDWGGLGPAWQNRATVPDQAS
jgi:hypothetical protein